MPASLSPTRPGKPSPAPTAAPSLARIIYRSHATSPLPAAALHAMVVGAQARNGAESISGVIVYDHGCFYQWLEGPSAGIDRVLRSINADPRHTGIRILGHGATEARSFPGWAMQVAGHLPDGEAGPVLHPGTSVLDALRAAPDDAAQVLAKLAPRRRTPPRRPDNATARILRDVILNRVVPELVNRRRRPAVPHQHPRTAELVQLLCAANSRAAAALMQDALGPSTQLVALLATLAEPAARLLGDLWADDAIDELDLTLGLCCLRTAVRQAGLHAMPAAPIIAAPAVLCAAQPDEPHALGTTLHPVAMWQSGWTPRMAASGAEDALLTELAARRFDCLDLSLSAVVAQGERLPEIAGLIRRARRASRNPRLAVVVSGRAISQPNASCMGADAAVPSTLHLVATVRRAVELRAG